MNSAEAGGETDPSAAFPPESFAGYQVFRDTAPEFAALLARFPGCGQVPGTGFAVLDRRRRWAVMAVCLFVSLFSGFRLWSDPGPLLLDLNWDFPPDEAGKIAEAGMAVFTCLAAAAAALWVPAELLIRRWCIFLPDRLIMYCRLPGYGWHTVFPRRSVLGTCLEQVKGGHILMLRLANEEEKKLASSFFGVRRLRWLAGLTEEWLQRAVSAAPAAGGVTGNPISSRSRLLEELPENVRVLTDAEMLAAEETMTARGQPAFSPGAAGIRIDSAPFAAQAVVGAFLTVWMCGWFSGAGETLASIIRGEKLWFASLLFVLVMGCIGLLPLRVFGSVLFGRLMLILEPGRIRAVRSVLLYRRRAVFGNGELLGFKKTEWLLHALKLVPRKGRPFTLYEDQEGSAKLRWLRRVLEEAAGLRELDSLPAVDGPADDADMGYGDMPRDGDRQNR